jgi:hypothetical protein
MSRRAVDIANALLRLGVLEPDDPEQRALREELFADPVLWDDVSERLNTVGYDLVQMLGHLGVRLSRASAVDPLVTAKNNLGLDARHVRVLVYLWVHLLYRQLKEPLRDEPTEPRGRAQTLFGYDASDEGEGVPTLPVAELYADFGELYSQTTVKGALTGLKRTGFVRESGGVLSAGPAMYVLLDHERMEEHVVGLARKGELPLPPEAG